VKNAALTTASMTPVKNNSYTLNRYAAAAIATTAGRAAPPPEATFEDG